MVILLPGRYIYCKRESKATVAAVTCVVVVFGVSTGRGQMAMTSLVETWLSVGMWKVWMVWMVWKRDSLVSMCE